MKKNFSFIILIMSLIALIGCSTKKVEPSQSEEIAPDESIVYFTKDISPEGVMRIFKYVEENVKGKVGIKVHFGEDGNSYYVPATMVEPLCKAINGTLIETNVAYTGRRAETETHIQLAKDHGFTFAPIDILDEGGTWKMPIDGGNRFDTAYIGKNLENYETIVYFTHFKGHGRSGFGGCIKNASMGMATIEGKKAMHKSDFPRINKDACILCNACVTDCPADAITLDPLKIDYTKCIGCNKCVSSCPNGAILAADDESQTRLFLEGLVEYAKPVIEAKNNIYFNIIINVSPTCDCGSNPKEPFVEDIGILVSTDIVAIEKAAHDLVDQHTGDADSFQKVNSVSGHHQIDYAEKLGMGNKKYKLINIDEK